MGTLDGTLHMSMYYDSKGNPRGALPGGYLDMPQCPNCKKPIRGLRRYGRVTKRAAIDAADKNFISHAQRRLSNLQERTNAMIVKDDLTHFKTLRHDLNSFRNTVQRPPCQKIFEASVALITKNKGGQGGGDVDIDMSTLPVPKSAFPYLGYYNLLSAQLSLLDTSALQMRAEQYARQAVKEFGKASFSLQTQEARLVLTQILLAKLETRLDDTVKTEQGRIERQERILQLASEPNTLLDKLEASGASFLAKHGNDVQEFRQKLLSVVQRARNATFYQSVSMEEKRAIKLAMQTEFRGSGHWYRCVNGHSYAIGECGAAMEQSRCPECNALVGGTNHSFVQGTERDEQMDLM
ncbi:unnamed protein product [Peronospora belbahrii]|uniref:RZ-type domain-containing protein n=1 Tax=Peronospora belbahrii TaxID=622444 RepID=A0AAU9L912_9STRA|nr:unnamed protein product [Peronospora belbahrii]CAH0522498.1 unnamed protein product [Peronospora belbahrii]